MSFSPTWEQLIFPCADQEDTVFGWTYYVKPVSWNWYPLCVNRRTSWSLVLHSSLNCTLGFCNKTWRFITYPYWLIDWLIMMGWDYVSELRSPTGLLFIPGWYVNTESHGDDAWLVHQSSLAVLPAETSGASRRNWQRSENFAYQYLKNIKRSLTRRKILRHGTSGFTSHPRGRCAADFYRP
jgi:hypothetical protein